MNREVYIMQVFDNVKDMIYCEIDDISHYGKLDMNSISILGELVDILKDIGSIEMFEEGINISDDEYSFNGYSRNNGYSQRRMQNGYRNGGNMNGYMRHNGYSREDAKHHIVQKLEDIMNEVSSEKDRNAIHRLIEQMENNQ